MVSQKLLPFFHMTTYNTCHCIGFNSVLPARLHRLFHGALGRYHHSYIIVVDITKTRLNQSELHPLKFAQMFFNINSVTRDFWA